jgi:lysophospholipase L1-like esterase
VTKITAYSALASTQPDDVLAIVDVHDTSMASTGTTKKVTAAALGITPYPDQQQASTFGLVSSGGLTGLYAAIANRNNARVDIPVIGDSITEGQGAATAGGRWIAQANRAIRARYPTTANLAAGGTGYIALQSGGVTTFTWPFTLASGTFTPIALGPTRRAPNMSTTISYTWTAPAGTTSVRIVYFDAAVAGSFTWKIGAGGTTAITNGSTGDGALSASIPITSGQVLTIAWASGSAFPEGIIHYAGDESSGITFHACGHFGWNSGTGSLGWQQTGSGFDWRPAIAAVASAAVGIMLGVNDAQASGGNFTGTQFAASITALITYLRGNSSLASLPVLLIVPFQPSAALVDPGGWAAYAAAIRSVAAATASCAVIDLNYRMPSAASGFNGGALYFDSLHPSSLGHALIGEVAAAGIKIA